MGLTASRYRAASWREFAEQAVNEILFSQVHVPVKKPAQLASGFPNVVVGDLLGRITATGKYRRYTRCVAKNAEAMGSTVIELEEATLVKDLVSPFKVGEAIDVGTSVNHAITAVDNVAKTVTLGTGLATAQADGAVIKLNVADGSEKAVGVAAHPVFAEAWNPETPNVNFLLDDDYYMDQIIGQAWLVRTLLRGLDALAITDLSAVQLNPAYDAIVIR